VSIVCVVYHSTLKSAAGLSLVLSRVIYTAHGHHYTLKLAVFCDGDTQRTGAY